MVLDMGFCLVGELVRFGDVDRSGQSVHSQRPAFLVSPALDRHACVPVRSAHHPYHVRGVSVPPARPFYITGHLSPGL